MFAVVINGDSSVVVARPSDIKAWCVDDRDQYASMVCWLPAHDVAIQHTAALDGVLCTIPSCIWTTSA